MQGVGVAAIGTDLVLLTLLTALVIWNSIPSCDPAGFIGSRLAPAQVLTAGGEQLRIFGEVSQLG